MATHIQKEIRAIRNAEVKPRETYPFHATHPNGTLWLMTAKYVRDTLIARIDKLEAYITQLEEQIDS